MHHCGFGGVADGAAAGGLPDPTPAGGAAGVEAGGEAGVGGLGAAAAGGAGGVFGAGFGFLSLCFTSSTSNTKSAFGGTAPFPLGP